MSQFFNILFFIVCIIWCVRVIVSKLQALTRCSSRGTTSWLIPSLTAGPARTSTIARAVGSQSLWCIFTAFLREVYYPNNISATLWFFVFCFSLLPFYGLQNWKGTWLALRKRLNKCFTTSVKFKTRWSVNRCADACCVKGLELLVRIFSEMPGALLS